MRKNNKKTSCVPLSKEKLRKAAEALPPRLKRKALAMLRNRRTLRRGSQRFAEQHPRMAMTEGEYLQIWEMRKKGKASFRQIEGFFGLVPNSGMGAFRACKVGAKMARTRKRKYAKA